MPARSHRTDDQDTLAYDFEKELGKAEADLFGGEWEFALGSVAIARAYGKLRAAKEVRNHTDSDIALSVLKAEVEELRPSDSG